MPKPKKTSGVPDIDELPVIDPAAEEHEYDEFDGLDDLEDTSIDD